jgi:hypothetical protein
VTDFKESNLDEAHYLIERGLRARATMTDEAFNLVMRDLAASLEQELLTSEPHETKKRESIYFQHRGLQAICATLKQWIEIGEHVQEEVQAQNEGRETE